LNAVSGLQGSITYTMAVVTNADTVTRDITVSATLGSGRVSQTVYGVAAAAVGSTQQASFSALGLKLTLNSSFSSTSDGTIIAGAGSAADFQVGAKNSINDRIGITLSSLKPGDLNAGLVANGYGHCGKSAGIPYHD
jgi:hypothetical protein